MSEAVEDHSHSSSKYIKIWGILLVLLVISFVGPELGIKWLTLITAFGIAIVKAFMVCAYFMHMNIEKNYIWYLISATLLLLLVFFAGVAPDVMKPSGQNWEQLYHEPTYEESQVHHGDHGDDHGDDHSDGGH
ncbi:cytochrome C oxidase subunit IV family protein [Opitutia bacterium ISCC 51]|nr:cytochrome C oxidase subunit IV family protein [Opitutae bacterium ISCC 51]QXD28595.1 cytochrome C oxidase subunit IV family protein [Opitutae bacterium ISCC 52]